MRRPQRAFLVSRMKIWLNPNKPFKVGLAWLFMFTQPCVQKRISVCCHLLNIFSCLCLLWLKSNVYRSNTVACELSILAELALSFCHCKLGLASPTPPLFSFFFNGAWFFYSPSAIRLSILCSCKGQYKVILKINKQTVCLDSICKDQKSGRKGLHKFSTSPFPLPQHGLSLNLFITLHLYPSFLPWISRQQF